MRAVSDLTGRVAVVTGSSRGIGKGVAHVLGERGATVYVTGRTVTGGSSELPGTIGETAAEVTRRGGVGIPVRVDHHDDSSVAALFARVADESGQIDILVNSASTLDSKADRLRSRPGFWDQDLGEWEKFHDIGLRSHYVASAYAARLMVPRRSGLIVNVSSAGAVTYYMSAAYGSAKAALDKLSHDMAHELAPYGVSVVSIWPGQVRTEMGLWMSEHGIMDISAAETPELSGRAVAAMATDARIAERSGRAFYTADLASDYDFTDVDGSVPQRPVMSDIVRTTPAAIPPTTR
ncbi:SDR family NAD(P)-dependent oxidoreductase [Nocardioides humi]|uniref:SDR family NAD(P)-dependent oxidoreductase n=1 Tax=Nocardioides humi TaxID=449461 RepID=A0ABN2BQC4_9ACTN|nr:SDR family NAD(P)-dependent oxidoreductase [Nocardioides humi]